MHEQTVNARFEIALNCESPSQKLDALAQALKEEGMTQRDMYELFDSFRKKHEHDTSETKYDAILDTMDLIVGYCLPNHKLFDSFLQI
jgi:hypothetical protein